MPLSLLSFGIRQTFHSSLVQTLFLSIKRLCWVFTSLRMCFNFLALPPRILKQQVATRVRRKHPPYLKTPHSTDLHQSNPHSQTQSPLCRLPAELRNKIYEYELGGHTFVILPSHTPPFNLKIREVLLNKRLQRRKRSGLSLTCRLIRHETRNIFLSSNTFMLSTHRLQQKHSHSPLVRHATTALFHVGPGDTIVAAGLPDSILLRTQRLLGNYPLEQLEWVKVLFFGDAVRHAWPAAEVGRMMARVRRCFVRERGGRRLGVVAEPSRAVFLWGLGG